MELLQQINENGVAENNNHKTQQTDPELISTSKPFIEANTIEYTLEEIRNKHIIPVFIKDNEPLISHADFIENTFQVVNDMFHYETILKPNIRLSHPIKGRTPEAKHKPANELAEHEKTLHYERMAFVIEIASVSDVIEGNKLSLIVGGVKSLTLDNLYNKKGADEHFKIFIGFKNSVCTNLCVWTDGFMSDVKANSIGQLQIALKYMIEYYNSSHHLYHLKQLTEYSLTEHQFAQIIGRCRMYNHLPKSMQSDIPSLPISDTQIGMVVKDYYRDDSFCRMNDGTINLWRLYNLFTNANKSSYIDSFIDRGVNTYHFCERLKNALKEQTHNWFLN
jgi:hypothetical protein